MCAYNCSLMITLQRLEADLPVLQYHGKWVFMRVWGVQEPVAALCALGNMLVHCSAFLWCVQLMRGKKKREARKCIAGNKGHIHAVNKVEVDEENAGSFPVHVWSAFFFVSSLAWLCATLFHIRDLPWTEFADYVSAAFSVWAWCASSLWHLVVSLLRGKEIQTFMARRKVCSSTTEWKCDSKGDNEVAFDKETDLKADVVRERSRDRYIEKIFPLMTPGQHLRKWTALVLISACVLGFSFHVQYLYPTLNYGKNMGLCVILTAVSFAVWLLWLALYYFSLESLSPLPSSSLGQSTTHSSSALVVFSSLSHSWKLVVFLIATSLLALLELLDFAPWALLLDAHALWHAGTIFTTALHLSFLANEQCRMDCSIKE